WRHALLQKLPRPYLMHHRQELIYDSRYPAFLYDNNKYKNPSGIFRADCAKLLQRNKLDIIESCNMQTK
ncbi:MAG: hypothetical protein IIV69_07000, partial [Peptococcaceae bacterium]|nr:hypothetical protein [Peptococcaceae bacterium]